MLFRFRLPTSVNELGNRRMSGNFANAGILKKTPIFVQGNGQILKDDGGKECQICGPCAVALPAFGPALAQRGVSMRWVLCFGVKGAVG